MSFLTPYERQARNTLRLTYALAALFLASLFGVIAHYFGLSIALLLCSPVIGGYGAWFLVNLGSKSYKSLRWLALNKVNGHFHAFSDIEVQVEWNDGQCEVAAKDVFNVMHEKPDAQTLRRLGIRFGERGFFQDDAGAWWFGETAVLTWLNERAHKLDQKAHQFHYWFERDVFPPLRKKAEIKGLISAPIQPPSIEKLPPKQSLSP
jgi:hypothetical protein